MEMSLVRLVPETNFQNVFITIICILYIFLSHAPMLVMLAVLPSAKIYE